MGGKREGRGLREPRSDAEDTAPSEPVADDGGQEDESDLDEIIAAARTARSAAAASEAETWAAIEAALDGGDADRG